MDVPDLLPGVVIPRHLDVITWNTCRPELWSLSQCLEFLELADGSQKKVFYSFAPTLDKEVDKEGAAKVRPEVITRLNNWIQHYKKTSAQSSGDPNKIVAEPFPQLYRPFGICSVDTLLYYLNKSQPWFHRLLKQHTQLQSVARLKFVLLYSLECHLAHLFQHREEQLQHLPHLCRFVKANPSLFDKITDMGLRVVHQVSPKTRAFFERSKVIQNQDSIANSNNVDDDDDDDNNNEGKRMIKPVNFLPNDGFKLIIPEGSKNLKRPIKTTPSTRQQKE